jgi:hypothetical protein
MFRSKWAQSSSGQVHACRETFAEQDATSALSIGEEAQTVAPFSSSHALPTFTLIHPATSNMFIILTHHHAQEHVWKRPESFVIALR